MTIGAVTADCDCSDLDGVSERCKVHVLMTHADIAARDAEIARLQGVLGILDGIVHVKPEGHIVGAVGDLRDEGDAARKALYELQAVMHTEDRPVRAENRTLRARVAQLEAIAGDALNELRDALDGKPNPKAREFLGLLEDRLDGGAR